MSRLREYLKDLADTDASARLRNAVQVLLSAANSSLALEEHRLEHGKREATPAAPPILTRLSGFMSDYYLDFDERDHLSVAGAIQQAMASAAPHSRKQAGELVCALISDMLHTSNGPAEAYRFFVVNCGASTLRYDFLVWKVGGPQDILFESVRNFVAVSWARSLVDVSKFDGASYDSAANF